MSALSQRLRRLEHPRGILGCAECGAATDGEREFIVQFDSDEGNIDLPEHCPGCGRRQVFTITFDRRG